MFSAILSLQSKDWSRSRSFTKVDKLASSDSYIKLVR